MALLIGAPFASRQTIFNWLTCTGFSVLDGDALIYETTTDNVTNDSAAQFAIAGTGEAIP